MDRIYLDYAASTPVDPEVFRAIEPYFSQKFGNPGSLHSFGQEAIAAVDRSRETIAKAIGAEFRQVIFTGSATEANNLALRGTGKSRIIISAIEHESILEAARELESQGTEVVYVSMNGEGVVDEKKIKEMLTPETSLVSVMYGNNEVGSIQPIRAIAKMIVEFRGKNKYPLFHTDAAQAFQFFDCNVKGLGVDLMTLSSHKIYGPKGAGVLYVKDIATLKPLLVGGGQEFGLRSGTENVPAIVGCAKAVELAQAARLQEFKRVRELRDLFWDELKKIFPKAELNGPRGAEGLPNILNIYFPGHKAEVLLTKLDLNGIAASSGSACRSRAAQSSYVIEALGYSKERAASSVRFSLGRPTTKQEIAEALKIMRTLFLSPS